MKNIYTKYFVFLIPVLFIFSVSGCVESLSESGQSSTAKPTIQLQGPLSNDTVMVGENYVAYQAYEGDGGQGLSFYEVYLNNMYVGRYEQGSDGTNPVIKLVVDSTLLGSKISYSVKVYNKGGRSDTTGTQRNIFVKDRIPYAPSNLILARAGDYAVTLLWRDNSYNESGFELWRKIGGSGNYTRIQTLAANTITTSDQGLSPFLDYFYKIRAFNSSGASVFSNEISTSSVSGGQWYFTAEAIGASLVILRWNDFITNERGFQIDRSEQYSDTWSTIAITGPDTTMFYDYNVSPSTYYQYRIRYFTTSAYSEYSNTISLTTYFSDVRGPADLTADYSPQNGVINVQWIPNSEIQKEIIVERKDGLTGNFNVLGTAPVDATGVNDSYNIKNGTTYFYRVRYKLGNQVYSSYSNTVSVNVP